MTHTLKPESWTLEVLLHHHFPGREQVVQEGEMDDDALELDMKGYDSAVINEMVTEERVTEAIRSFDADKAPGIEGIRPCFLQQGIEELVELLSQVYKACLQYGYVPQIWRRAKVVFIPKPGKESYDLPGSFRPICLTSILLKTLERLVDWHLRYFSPQVHLMPN